MLVETSVKWFAENNAPDLLLLDIQLGDGLRILPPHSIVTNCWQKLQEKRKVLKNGL
jgi:hypothetical protein